MGYERFGRVAMLKVGDRYMTFATPGCKKYDFFVDNSAAHQPMPLAA